MLATYSILVSITRVDTRKYTNISSLKRAKEACDKKTMEGEEFLFFFEHFKLKSFKLQAHYLSLEISTRIPSSTDKLLFSNSRTEMNFSIALTGTEKSVNPFRPTFYHLGQTNSDSILIYVEYILFYYVRVVFIRSGGAMLYSPTETPYYEPYGHQIQQQQQQYSKMIFIV